MSYPFSLSQRQWLNEVHESLEKKSPEPKSLLENDEDCATNDNDFNHRSHIFREIETRIDSLKQPIIVTKIKHAFKSDSITEALEKSTGVIQTALIMILNTLVPTMSEDLQTMTSTPLRTFKSEDDICSFLNAVIKSGLSADRGMLYILGNTAVGKTTLAETLKAYVKEPQREEPETILTGDCEDGKLLETEVAEVYPDQTLHGGRTVKLTQLGDVNVNVKLVEFKEEDPEIDKCILKTVDFGGQKEYKTCSRLLMQNDGTFLICFDSKMITSPEEVQSKYYSHLGTFIDLVINNQVDSPKIAIMATKVDGDTNRKIFPKIMENVKKHLSCLKPSKGTIYFVNEIMTTSFNKFTPNELSDLYSKMATLAASTKLNVTPKIVIPNEWLSWLIGIKNEPYCQTTALVIDQDISQKYKPVNISKEDIDILKQMIDLATIIKDSKPEKSEVQVEMEKEDKDTDTENKEDIKETNKQSVTQTEAVIVSSKQKQVNSPQENASTTVPVPDEKKKLSEELKRRLTFFKETVDILYYPDVDAISTLVIPDPMLGIRSVRLLINHKNTLKQTQFEEKNMLSKKGIVYYSDFKNTTSEDESLLPAEMIWNILIQMEIACPLEYEKGFATICLIPCLIGDNTEFKFKEKANEITQSSASLCVRYIFDKNTAASHGAYFKMLKNFTESFPRNTERTLQLCFSQKVELRQLGMVEGAYGHLYWTNPEDMAMDPELYEFMILEHETTFPDFDDDEIDSSKTHALHREIQVHLMPRSNKISKSMINILQTLDMKFSQGLPECRMYLACKKCPMETNLGFPLEKGFRPEKRRSCLSLVPNKPEHEIDIDCMKLWLKPFNINEFLENGIESIEMKPLNQVKKDIKTGDQIWVYRDPTSTKCNPIASKNPYAHVVVVVGVGDVIEVVHVAKNKRFWKGFCMGTIKKELIQSVIGDDDKVFFGHQIPEQSVSSNIRDIIAKRAKVCANPPLVFHYDRKNNCETFANIVMGVGNTSAQAKKADTCIKALCCCLCCCFTRRRKSKDLVKVVEKRMKTLKNERD